MEIVVGKTSGFCYGVRNAVNKTIETLKNTNVKKIYCLGELVHNKTVINDLKEQGLKIIENIEQADSTTIIRAHGVEKKIYEQAKKNNIDLVDLTCPNVLKIHDIAEEYAKKGYYIFVVGKKEHPEIIGIYSFCGENSIVIPKNEDVDEGIEKLIESRIKRLLIISQTTYNLKQFDIIIENIKQQLIDKDIEIEIKNTICLATEKRQNETRELSKQVDAMIIVGGRNSSNTNKLYNIAKENCEDTVLVENVNELNIELLKEVNKIGIMAGASTPQKSIDEIKERLK